MEIRAMWTFLTVGIFVLIATCTPLVSGLFAHIPQGWFVLVTILVVMFSCVMFVVGFVTGIDYAKVQIRIELDN